MIWFFFFYYRPLVTVVLTYFTILLLVCLLELFLLNINFICNLTLIYFIYILFHNFSVLIHGSHYLFDLTTRVDINDSLINLFNFFWTSFTYLPSFFFIIVLQLFLQKSLTNTLYSLPIWIIFYLLYNLELTDTIILNYQFDKIDINYNSINLLLTNSLNKYHPCIFYISVILFVYLVFHLFYQTFFNFQLFNLNLGYIHITEVTKSALTINIAALFLGSWWALQEGTWGGWWNWDPSEVLGLLFSLFILFVTHSTVNRYLILLWYYRITIYMIITIIAYLFIQLNFDLVSHNFGSKFFFFFNNNLFFLEVLTVLVSYSVLIYFKTQRLYIDNVTLSTWLKKNTVRHLHLIFEGPLLITVTVSIVVINSMIPLINYFIWTYLKINSFNFLISNDHLVFIFTLLLITPFYVNTPSNNYFTISYLGLNSLSYVITLLGSLKRTTSLVSQLHLLLITFLIVNIYSYSLTFIYWILNNNFDGIINNGCIMFRSYNTYHCNSYLIENSSSYTSNSNINITSWNVFYYFNSNSLNTFILVTDTTNFYNYYNLLENYSFLNLFIETNLLNNLIEIFVFFTTYLIFILLIRKSQFIHF